MIKPQWNRKSAVVFVLLKYVIKNKCHRFSHIISNCPWDTEIVTVLKRLRFETPKGNRFDKSAFFSGYLAPSMVTSFDMSVMEKTENVQPRGKSSDTLSFSINVTVS